MDTELTPAQYWEAQASMWHENYNEAADEIERLRGALREIEILEVDPRSSGQMWVETLKEVARKALGEEK